MSAQQSEPTAIDLAREACAQFVEGINDGAIMTTAVLMYEVAYINEDQDTEYKISYSVLTDSSMAAAVGVIDVGQAVFMEAVIEDND